MLVPSRPFWAFAAALITALLPAAAAGQSDVERVVWRGLIGETAFDIRATPGNVKMGAAGDSAVVSLTLRAGDVRRFVDALSKRTAPGRQRDTTWTLRIEEPGVSPGALSVTPAGRGPDKKPRYRLFVADDVITAVRQGLDLREMTLLLRTLRAAAAAPRAKPARRKPARTPVTRRKPVPNAKS